MIQQKRFGRAVGLPSTVQIVRELKIRLRRHAEAAAASELNATAASSGAPSFLEIR